MSRVLLVAPRFPYPSLSGGEKWAASLAAGLSARHEVSLFSFAAPGAEAHQTALAMTLEGRQLKKIYLLPRPSGAEARGLPALPALYWSAAAAARLGEAVRETRAEVVHILFSEMAGYAGALPADLPAVYTEIDSSYLFPWKYYLRETAGLKGFFKPGEFFKARAYARRYYPRFDAATSITASDGRDIEPYLSAPLAAVTPNAVAAADFVQGRPVQRREGEILFLGHYPHYPNEDAGLRLARRIFPLVKAERPGASLTLAGSCPTEVVKALAGADIAVPGTAADIRPFLWRAQVFAAPVRYGLGTKGKILEAFAAGLPVVASREAAASVEAAEPGRHLLSAASDRDFAQKTALLLGDAALRARLADAALELVKKSYAFDSVVAAVSGVYGKVLHGR
ncbi:MAG: glycosyltransferase [Elusimicrobiales bacterium]|nr:glycosyltransferase [Elusimicrobiales bacterium]